MCTECVKRGQKLLPRAANGKLIRLSIVENNVIVKIRKTIELF